MDRKLINGAIIIIVIIAIAAAILWVLTSSDKNDDWVLVDDIHEEMFDCLEYNTDKDCYYCCTHLQGDDWFGMVLKESFCYEECKEVKND